jgi:hypothetical protein
LIAGVARYVAASANSFGAAGHSPLPAPRSPLSAQQKTPRQLSPPRGVGFKWASRVWSLPTWSY